MNLRPATTADLPHVEALLVAATLPLAGVADALESFVVAERAGELIGVAGLEIRAGHALLRSVAVAPDSRGRGLGRLLVARVIAEAKARGISDLYLLTTTAERYFPSFGFAQLQRGQVPEPIRDTAEFRGACPASAVAMRLDLRRQTKSKGQST